MNEKEVLDKIAKDGEFDNYKLLGLYEGKKVYYFTHSEIETTIDGELIGMPVMYIENENIYTRILGNKLLKATSFFSKRFSTGVLKSAVVY